MNKQKKTICKSVRYNAEEFKKLKSLAEKSGKFPSEYIRDKALNTKILTCNPDESTFEYSKYEASIYTRLNNIARDTNTDRTVYKGYVAAVKEAVDSLERIVDKSLKPFAFEEKRKPIWLL